MADSAPERAPYRSLTGRTSFAKTYRTGHRARSGGVVVLAAAGEPGPPAVGIVAGKRVGGAVARNRAKRRLRSALCEVALAADTAYIVIADRDVLGAEFGRLVGWLRNAVSKLETERSTGER